MEFDIQPHAMVEGHKIHLPQKLREEMGVLVGQFLQLKGEAELVLEVGRNLDVFHECAYVQPDDFALIKGQAVEFKILDVTLGCDPEFFIMWGNALISAATYLPFSGEIGADGTLGELRPMYARHENDVVDNLGALIRRAPRQMKRSSWAKGFPADGSAFDLLAHSYFRGYTAGFHVHLGIPPEILLTRKDFNRAAMNHLVQCLDWYVSVPLVPLEEDHNRRLGAAKYGRPGDYRPSNITLEYRTPGAFYLRTPSLARGLLGLCLMVTENVVSRMKSASNSFVNLHKLSKADLQEIMPIPDPQRIRSVLLAQDPYTAQSHLYQIQKNLSTLPTYGKHQEGIEGFFSEVEAQRVPGPKLTENWKELK